MRGCLIHALRAVEINAELKATTQLIISCGDEVQLGSVS